MIKVLSVAPGVTVIIIVILLAYITLTQGGSTEHWETSVEPILSNLPTPTLVPRQPDLPNCRRLVLPAHPTGHSAQATGPEFAVAPRIHAMLMLASPGFLRPAVVQNQCGHTGL